MGNRKTLGDLVREYGNSDSTVNISFGFRPSGKIHLGNLMTASLASHLVGEIGPHLSHLTVTVCDTDLPDSNDWESHKKGYVKHFKHLPDANGCHENLAQHATSEVDSFLKEIQRIVPINYHIQTLTDVQSKPEFREGLLRVLETPETMRFLLPNIHDKGVLIYPLCPSCLTSYTETKKGKRVTYEKGKIHTFCENPDCPVEEFDVDLLDTSKELSIHTFIDLLRDSVVKPYVHIHVFGGDYSEEHGSNHIPKYEKILKVMEIASEGKRSPDLLIGPTVYARDGTKMSKTLDNGLNLGRLKEFFGSDYAQRIFNFTREYLGRGYNNIDFSLVQEGLLQSKV